MKRRLTLHTNPSVDSVFENYPPDVRKQMKALRQLVLDTAEQMPEITELEETLKWGEPSYLAKHGSTLRMDWKPKKHKQYALYFKCTSKLVETFRAVYGDSLHYEKNRAILFDLDQHLPVTKIKECIKATLLYHKVKDLPALGIEE